MKSLKIIIAVISISLLSTFSLNATDKKPSKVNKELRTRIVSIIGITIPIHLNQECTATIWFVLNTKNELVILTVDSENEEVKSYIKSKLNYQKMNISSTLKGEQYTVSLKIKVQK